MLEKAIKHETTFTVIMDRTSDFSNSKERVDLQIEMVYIRTIYLIDVKTPYDNLENLEEAAKANVKKYKISD